MRVATLSEREHELRAFQRLAPKLLCVDEPKPLSCIFSTVICPPEPLRSPCRRWRLFFWFLRFSSELATDDFSEPDTH